MKRVELYIFGIVLTFAVLTLTTPALADAIDGSWCALNGDHVSIEGPKIVTPAKHMVGGQYRRHAFLYKVPAGEPDADHMIYMQLLDESDMQSFVIEKDNKPGAQRNWQRCAFTS
jgi:hypothetical protein